MKGSYATLCTSSTYPRRNGPRSLRPECAALLAQSAPLRAQSALTTAVADTYQGDTGHAPARLREGVAAPRGSKGPRARCDADTIGAVWPAPAVASSLPRRRTARSARPLDRQLRRRRRVRDLPRVGLGGPIEHERFDLAQGGEGALDQARRHPVLRQTGGEGV